MSNARRRRYLQRSMTKLPILDALRHINIVDALEIKLEQILKRDARRKRKKGSSEWLDALTTLDFLSTLQGVKIEREMAQGVKIEREMAA